MKSTSLGKIKIAYAQAKIMNLENLHDSFYKLTYAYTNFSFCKSLFNLFFILLSFLKVFREKFFQTISI